MFEVKVLNESGYDHAIEGIGLSYNIKDKERLKKVAFKLTDKDGGHNKFLESMVVWLEIRASRFFWQEADTYRVGTTKQSESTIHTITKKTLDENDFTENVYYGFIDYLNELIHDYRKATDDMEKDFIFRCIKENLPEGFLQTRIVCTNYKTLRNMIWQRKNHKLVEWHMFIDELSHQLEHSDILFKGFNK